MTKLSSLLKDVCILMYKDNSLDANVSLSLNNVAPPSPEDVMTLRINGTHMSVSWILIPLTRSRGFIQSYVVNYQAVGTSKRETLTRIVGGEESSITLDDLQPVVAYDVQVAASTGAGMGDFSEPIPSTSELPLEFVIIKWLLFFSSHKDLQHKDFKLELDLLITVLLSM